jgi:hypothetical protein
MEASNAERRRFNMNAQANGWLRAVECWQQNVSLTRQVYSEHIPAFATCRP